MRTVFMLFSLLLAIVFSSVTPLFSESMHYEKVWSVTVYPPAVASEETGEGVLSKAILYVAYPGSGRVFFSVHPLTELDTQATARVAALTATCIAGRNFFDYDYYVVMESNTMIIGGPSAGALMTVGFLSIFLNKTIYPNTTMTGMVYPDGTIGPVGGLKGKLEAVAATGFKVFLIPLGERYVNVPNITIHRYPWGISKTVTYYKLDLVAYGEKLGVKVYEVSTIREAFAFFTGYNISCTLTTSIGLSDKLTNLFKQHVRELISYAEEKINSTTGLINRLPAYRRTITNLVNETQEAIEDAKVYLSKGYYIYAVNQAFYGGYLATYTNWVANYIAENINIDDIIGEVNETLINASKIATPLIAKGLSNKTFDQYKLEVLIAINVRLVDAQYSFSEARKMVNTDLASAIDKLAYTYMRARSVIYWSHVYNAIDYSGISIDLSRVIDTALLVYSIADNIVSYTLTLAQDLGTRPATLDKALEYLDKAREAEEGNETLAMIGESLYATSYAAITMHRMFSLNKDIDRVLEGKLGSEVFYSICITQSQSLLSRYYYIYGNEAGDAGDLEDALVSYTMATLYTRFIWLISQNITANIELYRVNPYKPLLSSGVPSSHRQFFSPLWFIVGVLVGALATYIPITLLMRKRKLEQIPPSYSYTATVNVQTTVSLDTGEFREEKS